MSSDFLSKYQRPSRHSSTSEEPRARYQSEMEGVEPPVPSTDEMSRRLKHQSSILEVCLKTVCLLLILLLCAFLAKMISGYIFTPAKQIIVGGRCNQKFAEIDNVKDFNSSVTSTSFEIPATAEFDPREWVQEKLWKRKDFSRQMDSILAENLIFEGSGKNRGNMNIKDITGHTRDETLKIIQETNYLRNLKLKLMDYASSKYAFSNNGVNSDEFNNMYKNNLNDYKVCKDAIRSTRQEIERRLVDIDKIRDQKPTLQAERDQLQRQLNDLNSQIDIKNQKLNSELQVLDGEIREYEDKLNHKSKINGIIVDRQRRVDELRKRIPQVKNTISKARTDFNTYNSKKLTLTQRMEKFITDKMMMEKRKDFMTGELNFLMTNRDIQGIVSRVGQGCDETRIKEIDTKMRSKIEEENKIKSILEMAGEYDVLKGLDFEEDQEALDQVMKSYKAIRKLATKFEPTAVELKISKLRDKISDITKSIMQKGMEIDQIRSEVAELGTMAATTQLTIEEQEALLRQLEQELSELLAEIKRLQIHLNFSKRDLEAMKQRRASLESRLQREVGDILNQRDRIQKRIIQIERTLGTIDDEVSNHEAEILRLIRVLNNSLNSCKTKELILEQFKIEYEVCHCYLTPRESLANLEEIRIRLS